MIKAETELLDALLLLDKEDEWPIFLNTDESCLQQVCESSEESPSVPLSATIKDIRLLLRQLAGSGYVRLMNPGIDMSEYIDLTALGLHYKAYCAERKREKVIGWVRWGVTTLIALAAFIKSFFFI